MRQSQIIKCCSRLGSFVLPGLQFAASMATAAIVIGTTASPAIAMEATTQTTQLHVGEGTAISKETVEKTRLVVLERARSLGIADSKIVVKGAALCITVFRKPPVPVDQFATTPGSVSFQVLPHGARYSKSASPIAAVRFGPDEIGQNAILLKMSDPKAFEAFTAAHLNSHVGIFVDNRLISEMVVVTPVTDDVEVAGAGIHDVRWRLLAAVVSSGPLPVPVDAVGLGCK